jgi:hypothetical protein
VLAQVGPKLLAPFYLEKNARLLRCRLQRHIVRHDRSVGAAAVAHARDSEGQHCLHRVHV